MREFLRPGRLHSWLFILAFAAVWPGSVSAAAKQRTYDLPLPRAVAPGEALVARVSVGPLKAHMRIIVRIRNGEIAGTISPFGAQERQGGTVYTIPLPSGAVKDGIVRLLVEVVEKDAGTRPPTSEEVRDITLAYVAVTDSNGKAPSGTR
jgi:hypothetical protein